MALPSLADWDPHDRTTIYYIKLVAMELEIRRVGKTVVLYSKHVVFRALVQIEYLRMF